MPVSSGKRFVVVTGKGGVGKTTVAAALAVGAARRGASVLVAMCNEKERLSRLLGTGPIGSKIVPVLPRIDAVNITPEAALEEYGMMVLKIRAVYRAIFDNRMVKSFLRGVPGIDEWAMLGKTWYHTTEEVDGRPRWDLVILDADPLADIGNLAKVYRTIKGGVVYDPEALMESIR